MKRAQEHVDHYRLSHSDGTLEQLTGVAHHRPRLLHTIERRRALGAKGTFGPDRTAWMSRCQTRTHRHPGRCWCPERFARLHAKSPTRETSGPSFESSGLRLQHWSQSQQASEIPTAPSASAVRQLRVRQSMLASSKQAMMSTRSTTPRALFNHSRPPGGYLSNVIRTTRSPHFRGA